MGGFSVDLLALGAKLGKWRIILNDIMLLHVLLKQNIIIKLKYQIMEWKDIESTITSKTGAQLSICFHQITLVYQCNETGKSSF
jgi:hypothetical protein